MGSQPSIAVAATRLRARLPAFDLPGFSFEVTIDLIDQGGSPLDGDPRIVLRFHDGCVVEARCHGRDGPFVTPGNDPSASTHDNVHLALTLDETVTLLEGDPVLDGLLGDGRYASDSIVSLSYFHGLMELSTFVVPAGPMSPSTLVAALR